MDSYSTAETMGVMYRALWTILANTEEGAIKHGNYDELAKSIADTARSAIAAYEQAVAPNERIP